MPKMFRRRAGPEKNQEGQVFFFLQPLSLMRLFPVEQACESTMPKPRVSIASHGRTGQQEKRAFLSMPTMQTEGFGVACSEPTLQKHCSSQRDGQKVSYRLSDRGIRGSSREAQHGKTGPIAKYEPSVVWEILLSVPSLNTTVRDGIVAASVSQHQSFSISPRQEGQVVSLSNLLN